MHAVCFVEIRADNKLQMKVSLQVEDGETHEVDIEYEWIPPV